MNRSSHTVVAYRLMLTSTGSKPQQGRPQAGPQSGHSWAFVSRVRCPAPEISDRSPYCPRDACAGLRFWTASRLVNTWLASMPNSPPSGGTGSSLRNPRPLSESSTPTQTVGTTAIQRAWDRKTTMSFFPTDGPRSGRASARKPNPQRARGPRL